MSISTKRILVISAVWLSVNLIQAALLGLDPDEAYYWIYSLELDWGYFDHPPLIAILIRIGSSLLSGELGVRLLVPLLSTGTFLLLWDLAGRPGRWRKLGLLGALFAAMPMLHIYAFVATPDAPLLFFSALFFWMYQRFVLRPQLGSALALGLVMALLLYSKYHGVLLIFFTLLSNWRLLRNPWFYLAGFFGALLFLPHLYWQYLHDFPSFRYHLSGRDDPYELKHTTNYLLNQLLIFSPLLLPLIIRTLWRRKPQDKLEQSFRFVIFGFWAFFFYTTFKGHVEPQWTVLLSLCFILLLYREALKDTWLYRWLIRLSLVSFGLLMVARIVLVWPGTDLRTPFNQAKWIAELRANTGDTAIIFQDSYRLPAMYEFYTGQRAYTFTDVCYRRNQYDIHWWETDLQDRTVWLAGQITWENPEAQATPVGRKTFALRLVDSLQISQKVTLEPLLPTREWQMGDSLFFDIRLTNPYPHDIYPQRGNLPLSIRERYGPLDCLDDRSTLRLINPPEVWPAQSAIVLRAGIQIREDLSSGTYDLYLCIQTGDLPPAFASKPKSVRVVEGRK